jgi:hypothetical protein
MPKPQAAFSAFYGPLTKRLRRLRKATKRARFRRPPTYTHDALELQLSAFLGPLG